MMIYVHVFIGFHGHSFELAPQKWQSAGLLDFHDSVPHKFCEAGDELPEGSDPHFEPTVHHAGEQRRSEKKIRQLLNQVPKTAHFKTSNISGICKRRAA